MLDVSYEYLDLFKAKARHITGLITYINNGNQYELSPTNNLKSFKIEKTSPKGKFFGFAVSQKITIETIGIVDNIQKGDKLIPYIGIKDFEEDLLLPYFYVDTVDRSKVNNTTTITGYDILYKADYININTLSFDYPMYISAYGREVCEAFGAYASFDETGFLVREAPNFGGNETLRSVLTEIAEATGTICYVSQEDNIRFRTLQADFTDVLTADDYYTLTVGEPTTLTKVASNTELGNNYEVGSAGFTQVLFENPFITLLDDSDAMTLLTSIGNKVRNLSSVDYSIEWRGCPAYEIGDYVILQDKEGNANYTFYYNETLEYNGGLKASSNWEAGNGDNANTVSGLTKTLRQTYAKVDKVNEKVELVAADVAKIELDANGIISSVNDELEALESRITQTTNSISSTVSKQEKTITEIQQDLDGISLTYNSANGTASITIGDVTVSELVDGDYVDKTVAGINLDGYVKFNDLKNSGSTTINGSNITTGTISADRINMTGAIAWSDLTSGCQNTIESMVGDGAELPSYIKSTYIDATTVQSPTIVGGSLTSTSGTKTTSISDSKINFSVNDGYKFNVGYIQAYDDGDGTASSASHGIRIKGSYNGSGYSGGIKIESSDYAGVAISAGTDIYFFNPNYPNGISLTSIINNSGSGGGGSAVFG